MIRQAMRAEINGYQLYHSRRDDIVLDQIGFTMAEEPLSIPLDEYRHMQAICEEVANFVAASDELYKTDEQARQILDAGKPDGLLKPGNRRHLFFRPDFILDESGGFTICEIETSPFGLGLAASLDRAYQANGHETAGERDLAAHVAERTEAAGTVVLTDKTKAYAGQLAYLAENVFSVGDRSWEALHISDINGLDGEGEIYRAFYLHEYGTDTGVRALVDGRDDDDFTPSLTPHLEEKAMMAFIWDKRWQGFYEKQLGSAAFALLREVIPPSWMIGHEEQFAPGMPNGHEVTNGLAGMSRSARKFVLKVSGFDASASWSEGVSFLHQLSAQKAEQTIYGAQQSGSLFVVQEFRQPRKVPVKVKRNDEVVTEEVKVRLTPYIDPENGEIIIAKATGRRGSDFIHASSDSINCAVGVS